MTLLKKYPPEGFIKQKYQYMVVKIFYIRYVWLQQKHSGGFSGINKQHYILLLKIIK